MEVVIIAGHGSPNKQANNLDILARAFHHYIHPHCQENCVRIAYLQFCHPTIQEALDEAVRDGARCVVVHPFFLTKGMHVTKDIPFILESAKVRYPDVSIYLTEPLGIHKGVLDTILARIKEAKGLGPKDIEDESMRIIEEEIPHLIQMPPGQAAIIKRVVHATADPEYANTMIFSQDAVEIGLRSIMGGRDILVDVRMVSAGISTRLLEGFGGRVLCAMDYVPKGDGWENSTTRSEAGMEAALRSNPGVGIVAIGNAPTALIKAIGVLAEGNIRDTLVIGVPVGFVKALESKVELARHGMPFITNISRKGGSSVAVAILNALIRLAKEV